MERSFEEAFELGHRGVERSGLYLDGRQVRLKEHQGWTGHAEVVITQPDGQYEFIETSRDRASCSVFLDEHSQEKRVETELGRITTYGSTYILATPGGS